MDGKGNWWGGGGVEHTKSISDISYFLGQGNFIVIRKKLEKFEK